ncbi:response regulator [Pseudonocardia sp. CA-107938]|uniref:response regulator n=1 Tax=Pseudonocardia sp. CA-107938 TaxID=3240021 RepID=UPI003D8E528B
MIRILLVDDQPLVRAGLRAMLDGREISVVAEVGNGLDAVREALRLCPDVVLMDIRMPELDGLEATRRILVDDETGTIRVIVLTTFDLDEHVYRALRVGASGFLLKDAEPTDLIRAIRAVANGDAMLSPSVTRRLLAEFATRAAPTGPPLAVDQLTSREREVLRLVVAGLTNEEIAGRLVISLATAKTHTSRILAKLGVRDRAQLIVMAYESGLVRPGARD